MSTEFPQQPTFPPLVVASDPVASDRATRGAFIATVGLAVGSGLLAIVFAALGASVNGFALGALSVFPFAVAFAYAFFLALRLAWVRGLQSVERTVLVLDASGLHGTLPQGTVDIPWVAFDRLSLRSRGNHRVITFHLLPGVTTTSPGIRTTLSPRLFATIAERGFPIGSAAVSTPLETIADASRAFTAGRLVVR
ncbi:hypothetical protein KXS11_08635 [Plantibacter flavus]|uniref:hypothetical protein n=1 Tax=Plantibacter flavus TaxID=150123 RepID=UPI003F16D8AB